MSSLPSKLAVSSRSSSLYPSHHKVPSYCLVCCLSFFYALLRLVHETSNFKSAMPCVLLVHMSTIKLLARLFVVVLTAALLLCTILVGDKMFGLRNSLGWVLLLLAVCCQADRLVVKHRQNPFTSFSIDAATGQCFCEARC